MKKLYSAVLSLSAHYCNRNTVIKVIVVMMMMVLSQVGLGQKHWSGAGTLPGQWSDANNWSPLGVPGPGDQVILDNSIVGVSYTVTLPNTSVFIAQLTISPTVPNTITLILPNTNNANPGLRATTGFTGLEDIIINNGGIFRNSSTANTGAGGVEVLLVGGIMRINNGGRFIHNSERVATGTSAHLSSAAGTESGTFEYDVPNSTTFAISSSGTTYGNLVLSRSFTSNGNYDATGTSPFVINGDFLINPGVSYNSTMSGLGTFTLNGNLTNLGTTCTIGSSQATTFNATGVQTISGSGTTTINGSTTIGTSSTTAISQTVNFNGAVAENGSFQINQGGNPAGAGIWTYGVNSNLIFANSTLFSSTTANNVAIWWPTSAGPKNVTMNGSGGITMDVPRTITGILNLTNGIITTTSILTMDAGSSYTGSGPASYIDGKLQKIGNTNFKFPVGKSIFGTTSCVPIEISVFGSAPASTAFTAEYKRGSAYSLGSIAASIAGGIDHLCKVDYWTLESTGGGTPTPHITAYWTNENTFSGSAGYINSLADLALVGFNGTSNTWDNFSGVGSFLGNTAAGSITWTTVPASALTAYSLGGINFNNPLPVTVSYLQGAKQNAGNLINWKVSCISNLNATMILQRSTDNRNFTDITTITATAARCQQPFDYIDIAPASGTNYYRLKTINDDGKITYSIVIVIVNKATGFDIVSLLPNLVRSNALLNISSAQKTSLQVVITDAMGRPVQKTAYALIAGSNQFEITVTNLPAGMYRITGTTAEGITKTIAFVKQ